ncbi:uncharacterized protein [Atheta coriaria]|uniref:uncharacterized protein n=1 Tax=Dalotia coriaria TaxID=877792 RepID=UPI0031F35017
MNGNNGNLLERAEVDELLKAVYDELKIRPKNVNIETGSNPGDGYMSFLTRVDITTDDDKEVHVVMKGAPRIEEFRKLTPVHDAFLRETLFYEEVVPTFRKFQTETCPVREPFDATAKFYHACKDNMKEVLVMENIKTKGFKLWDRMKYMDNQHIELVLKTYGKYHAVSYAMQQQDPEGYARLKEKMILDVFRLDNVDPAMFEIFDAALQRVKPLFADDAKASKKLNDYRPIEIWEAMIQDLGDYPVICHGDCWVNNMMFKYDDVNDPTKPTKICLLDFQIMRLGSPVSDLSYFFYVSAPKQYLDQLDKYLRVYHDSLTSSLLEMKCKVTMSFEDLKKEWKRGAVAGYNMSLVVSKIMASEGDEIIDFVNMTVETDFTKEFGKESKHDAFINNKLKLLTQHMFDNGFM